MKRNYAAADNVARYGDFKKTGGSADYELQSGLREVRQRVRYLARNSGTIKRYIALMQDNIVGSNGFTFQGMNPRVEDAFRKWSQQPTVDGKMTLVDFERLMVASWARDGEFLFEIVTNSDYRDMISLNPLEADMLDETLSTTNPITRNQIKMGVEIDILGRPVAYHLLTVHPGDISSGQPEPQRRWRRVPAERIVHVYERLRPGQTRGEPPASASVNAIKMLDGYREAETMNRRIAAAMMGFFSRDVPRAEGIQALADMDGEEGEAPLINLEPGTFKQLPDGTAFHKFDPGGSQTDYAQFEAQVKKDVAMGLSISSYSLNMDTAGVSYSSGRSVIQEDRDFYKGRQSFFIRLAMMPIIRWWMRMHALTDGTSIPPTRLEAFTDSAKFRGRGWDWIDPAKDIKANAEAIRTLQTSYTRIAADRGMDVGDLFAEIQRDNEMMEKFGLTPNFDNANPEPINSGGEDDSEDT